MKMGCIIFLPTESAKRAHEAKVRRKAEKQAALEAKLTS